MDDPAFIARSPIKLRQPFVLVELDFSDNGKSRRPVSLKFLRH